MRTVIRVIGIIILIFIVLQFVLFCIGKFGWKIFGFDMCEDPNTLLIESVSVTDEKIDIAGHTFNSACSYVGYIYEIKDNVLYIGIKQNLLLGFTERNGGYSFSINGDFKTIDSVYLVNKMEEKCIWMAENKK